MPTPSLTYSPARPEQLPLLDEIRLAAFAPVFTSFRAILGDELYQLAQARDDAGQADLLVSMLQPGSKWEIYVAEHAAEIVGFVSLQLNHETKSGEIGLNAVHPKHAGRGIGTAMYEFALNRMRQVGMLVATVSTGGDPSHAPARQAYRKAGFDAEIPSVWMCRRLV